MATKDTASKLKNFTPNPDITEDELAVMRVEVLDRIIVARVGLLLRHPFFGNMATRLRILAADDWLGTAAVDGSNLLELFQVLYNVIKTSNTKVGQAKKYTMMYTSKQNKMAKSS